MKGIHILMCAAALVFMLNFAMLSHAEEISKSETVCPKCKNKDCRYAVGVNWAGAEFAGHEIPGIEGRHYGWPTAESLDYWKEKNIHLIRLPFKWERLQPELMKDFDPKYREGLEKSVKLLEDRGMKVILDVHNYAVYRKEPIGSEAVPVDAFADLWKRLALMFKDCPAVWGYGLMNEPSGKCDWPKAAQAAIAAIREADKKTMIIVANDYAGWAATRAARECKTGEESAAWAEKGMRIPDPEKLIDPSDNLMFELHAYFDHDASGTYRNSYTQEIERRDGPEVRVSEDTGIDRIRPFVQWLKKHRARGLLGEYSAPANPDKDPRWMKTLEKTAAYLEENCIPSTYWSAGTRWTPGHSWVIERSGWQKTLSEEEKKKDRPQLEMLKKYMRGDNKNW